MKLTRVTITGADDNVDQGDLFQLALDFPWLELGILYSHERSGAARYPSTMWRQGIFGLVGANRLALHFCGAASREAMAGIGDSLPHVPEGCRLQLNGFSNFKLPGLALAKARPDMEVVLQCGSQEAIGQAVRLWGLHSGARISALYDASGGRGIHSAFWPTAPSAMALGYAGGLNEFNVEATLHELVRQPGGDFWIDLETGARNGRDEFDVAKARRILELAKPFVEAT